MGAESPCPSCSPPLGESQVKCFFLAIFEISRPSEISKYVGAVTLSFAVSALLINHLVLPEPSTACLVPGPADTSPVFVF